MKVNIVGVMLSIVVLFISLFILPIYFIGVINWRNDTNTAQTAARNFVDRVIDSREVSTDALDDFTLDLASCTTVYDYKIYHEVKVTNPDSITYMYTEDLSNWSTGDIITVNVKPIGRNIFQTISATMMGISYNDTVITFSAMVR